MCELLLRTNKNACGDYARGNSTGASYPQIFDAFNVNPAAIPTKQTPLGLEIYHGDNQTNISIIKGLESFGLGLATSQTNGNFFSNMNNLEIALNEANIAPDSTTTSASDNKSTQQSAYSPSQQVGFAFPLLGKGVRAIAPIVGVSLKKNAANDGYKYNTGLSINTKIAHVGASLTKDNFGEKAFNANFGFRIFNVLFDYTYFANYSNIYSSPDHTQIFSVSYTWLGLDFNLAQRTQIANDLTDSDIQYLRSNGINYKKSHVFAGVQYKWNEKLAIGIFHNYILDVNQSLVVRIFF